MDINYPNYPCVAMRGKVNNICFNADGTKNIKDEEVMFYPLNGIDDLTHVDHCRKRKGYAVVGFANLEKIVERAPYKAKEVAQIKAELSALVYSPEMRWAQAEEPKIEEASLETRAKRAKKAGATTLGDLIS